MLLKLVMVVAVLACGLQAAAQTLAVGGAHIQVEIRGAAPDIGSDGVLAQVRRVAAAVAAFYGRFPVADARVVVVVDPGGHGVSHGTTWGDVAGVQGLTRIHIGQHTTAAEFETDWRLTHELVHMAFPDMPDDLHWMEEGLATYLEPLVRVQAGQMSESEVWTGMVDGMPNGEPSAGSGGLNGAGSWGRTYWGGALFFLVADVEIRRQTHGAHGLQDAVRALVQGGGTIDQSWDVRRILDVADKATDTHVLRDLYARWSRTAVPVDLAGLWKSLGVRKEGDDAVFNNKAPEAALRRSIESQAVPIK